MPKLLAAVISLAALAVAVAHLVRPDWTIDAVTLALLGVAVLPWLAPYVRSVKLPGGLEVEFQEIKQAAKNAERRVEFLERLTLPGAAASAPLQSEAQRDTTAAKPMRGVDSAAEMRGVVERYNAIRRSQPSGPARTQAMTDCVRDMIRIAAHYPDFDARAALADADGGQRLAAYAYLYYAQPRPDQLEDLIKSVTERDNPPFGQYWGLMAIQKTIRALDQDVPDALIERLRRFQRRLPAGSDRAYVLTQILREANHED